LLSHRGIVIVTMPETRNIMADKSPSQRNSKKVGKTLKEKRLEKHAKKTTKTGLLGDSK
jgi:hypothetical protein